MSKFSRFMKQNKRTKENGFYAPTASLCDENGEPLQWEFRHIPSRELEDIREDCTTDVQVPGRPNMYRPRIKTSLYLRKIIAASVVNPDLQDAELQDSYGVISPEDLVMAMVDDAGEYNDLATWVQNFQGFNTTFEDKVKTAKN